MNEIERIIFLLAAFRKFLNHFVCGSIVFPLRMTGNAISGILKISGKHPYICPRRYNFEGFW